MSRKRLSGAKGGPSGSCHRAGIHKKGSLVLDAFAPSSPNLPALIQLAGIIVQPVTQPFFDSIDPLQKSQLLTNKYPFAKPKYRSACAATRIYKAAGKRIAAGLISTVLFRTFGRGL